MSTTYKVNVGTLTLYKSREVRVPQSYAAYHETVLVEPGTYDVFAYLSWCDGGYRIHSLAAQAEGVTIDCYYGKGGRQPGGKTVVHIELPTYGRVTDRPALVATLHPAIVREEWDTAGKNGIMWRRTWDKAVKIKADKLAPNGHEWISGQTITATIDDVAR